MIGQDIERKLEFYYEEKKTIHLRCNNNRFYNGTVKEIDKKNQLLILIEIKLGEIPITFEEITTIEPYLEKDGDI